MRKLKYHEQKLLKKVNFLEWKRERGELEQQVMRRYHITGREDYQEYNKICGMVTKLVTMLKKMPPQDPTRIEMTEALLEKLYSMGVIPSKKSLALCYKLSVSSLCRRRLAVIMLRLNMAENMREAVTFVEQGHIRVGPDTITEPAFLVTRNMEDFVTWVDSSKIKRKGRFLLLTFAHFCESTFYFAFICTLCATDQLVATRSPLGAEASSPNHEGAQIQEDSPMRRTCSWSCSALQFSAHRDFGIGGSSATLRSACHMDAFHTATPGHRKTTIRVGAQREAPRVVHQSYSAHTSFYCCGRHHFNWLRGVAQECSPHMPNHLLRALLQPSRKLRGMNQKSKLEAIRSRMFKNAG